MSEPKELANLTSSALVARLLKQEALVPAVVIAAAEQLRALVDLGVACVSAGGRVIYVGAGTSGRLAAADAAECWATFGVDESTIRALVAGGPSALSEPNPGAEDEVASGLLDQLTLTPNDLVLGISASGTTPFTLDGLRHAHERGSISALIASSATQIPTEAADLAVHLPVGEELLRGSTRLKAGTSAKIALGTFSTALMIRLGHTRGRDMVRLSTSNEKLRARAAEIIARQAQCTHARASRALREANGNVLRAIDDLESEASQQLGPPPEQALGAAPSDEVAAKFCIGIDAGGSKVKVTLGIAGPTGPSALATVVRDAANLSTAPKLALDSIQLAVEEARRKAGCPEGRLGSACIGAAGAGAEAAVAPLREWATRQLSTQALVTNDAEPLLWSMTSVGTRIGLICGTGSFGLGVGPSGVQARAGGWGWRFGEPGSGYALARTALLEFAHQVDSNEPISRLQRALMAHWGASAPGDLRVKLNRLDVSPAEIASGARPVLEAAAEGDEDAGRLIDATARELAGLALQLIARLGSDLGVEVVCAGGLISNSSHLRRRLEAHLAGAPGLTCARVRCVDPSTILFHRAAQMLVLEGS